MVGGTQEQEGLGLEYLEKLTFFDDKFEYHGKSYDYRDIEHVEFTAVTTKHSVNFVPAGTSYDASLLLHLRSGYQLHVKQERAFLKRKGKERSEAVMRAAGIFMGITFNQRIEAYERQMEEKGFVIWGRHQISRNGDLFRKYELRFNIFKDNIECNLGPFQVECRKRNPGFGDKLKEMWSGCAEAIDISTDKDCFLYIMKYYLGLSWRSQPVPKKRQSGFEPAQERAAYGDRDATTETQAFSLRAQHLRVLGLDDSATNMDVKIAYRDLARKHHPDLLRAQGVPVDDIENAEEIMKVINSAYEWLENDAEATT